MIILVYCVPTPTLDSMKSVPLSLCFFIVFQGCLIGSGVDQGADSVVLSELHLTPQGIVPSKVSLDLLYVSTNLLLRMLQMASAV